MTHIPSLRDEAGSSLIWNGHLKDLDKRNHEKVLQHRRIGACPVKTTPLSRQQKIEPTRSTFMNDFELPAWLGHCIEEYVRHFLPVLQREATKRMRPGALAVPNERDGKGEALMLPGWDGSARALFEEVVKQLKVYFGVPAVVENFCGHSENVSIEHCKTTTYLKNLKR